MQASPSQEPEPGNVISPFANSEATVTRGSSGGGAKIALWIVLGVLLLGAGIFGGVVLTKYLNQSNRTLESFPVAKYLENDQALAGSRFKADIRVEANLDYKENVGRIMLFTTPEDSRPFAVLVPPALSAISFTKGQTYSAELEVKEGGIIYANSCVKN